MNKSLKRVIVSAMALSLLVPAVLAPKAEAAAKPKLSAKSVKVTVGAKKKVTVKKVKAKKIKPILTIYLPIIANGNPFSNANVVIAAPKRKKGRKNNFDCES